METEIQQLGQYGTFKRNDFRIVFFLIFLHGIYQSIPHNTMEMEKSYLVKKISRQTENKGAFLSNTDWENAIKLVDFQLPWQDKQDRGTEFMALHDADNLYLRYVVLDGNILTYRRTDRKMEVVLGDRIEIFLAADTALDQYYCLEIDPNGRVLDYSATHYRKFDMDWGWPDQQLSVQTDLSENGYLVDVTIGLESLRRLGLISKNRLRAGIFRADCMELAPGLGQKSKIEWISWVDPKTKKPDFHVPTSFGILELEE